MEKLKQLASMCKGTVTVQVNGYKNNYETASQHLANLKLARGEDFEIPEHVQQTMIQIGSVVEVSFYPDSPVGFYSVYHWDLEAAIDEALEIMKGHE